MKRKHMARTICSILLACILCLPNSAMAYAEDTSQTDIGSDESVYSGEEDNGVDTSETTDSLSDATGDSDEIVYEEAEKVNPTETTLPEKDTTETLTYSAHVQSIGWQEERSDGEVAGTTGRSKRMEAIRIQVNSVLNEEENEAEDPGASDEPQSQDDDPSEEESLEGLSGSVEYQAHSQSFGWLDWVKDGEIGGTVGKAKRLEAIRIRLTGELAEKYDIYYKVHCASFGDLGWAKNGQKAGTAGYAKSIEAITIKLVEKGSADAPAQTEKSFFSPTDLGRITYSSHCQSYGWMKNVADGKVSGTQGKSKRMEAIRIYVGTIYDDEGNELEGSVEYQAYCQSYGWRDWVKDGAVGGTVGKAKRMEAIRIKLTGELADVYDVYYKVHCASWGSLGWASNGEIAGTIDTARAIESIEIKLVKKGVEEAPSSDVRSCIDMGEKGTIEYETFSDGAWTDVATGPSVSGSTGKQNKIEAVRIRLNTDGFDGGVTYRAYMQGTGWQPWVSDGEIAGSTEDGKRVEAIQIKLTGDISKYCSVYYSSHVQAYGWLGWAKNGGSSGTNNCSYRMEALRATIVAKTAAAPGSTSGAFQTSKYQKLIASFTTTCTAAESSFYNMKKALASFNGVVIYPGQTMSFFGVAGPCGAAQGYVAAGVVGGLGYGGGICQASTTLYGAALRAGLSIVERRNHSVPSTYVPIGQDAMVSYGSSDLKVRNDFSFAVKLKTYVTGRTLHVEIYGNDPGWFDSVKVNSWYTGSNSAAAERIFYKNGKAVKRQALPSSYYY